MTLSQIIMGDCRDVMRSALAEPDSIDAIITDPPYGLNFMGRAWDRGVPGVEFWAEMLRLAKPGAHLLAFGGTRTHHRMMCAIEDAGWELRDTIMWVYGSGFPKSLDVSKAIDKAAGAERAVIGVMPDRWTGKGSSLNFATDRPQAEVRVTGGPASDEAMRWQGWGTALKPAWEPIIMARKPLIGTVAANVQQFGTGALNIDLCRVEAEDGTSTARTPSPNAGSSTYAQDAYTKSMLHGGRGSAVGRWPANLIHDGSEEVLAGFPQTGISAGGGRKNADKFGGGYAAAGSDVIGFGDSGSAARFFYCAKASKRDRNEGLDGLDAKPSYMVENGSRTAQSANGVRYERATTHQNNHPTVKPTALMRYLVRLITPPGGTILDPFCGSGSTGKAAALEWCNFIGIDTDPDFVEIARRRIEYAQRMAA